MASIWHGSRQTPGPSRRVFAPGAHCRGCEEGRRADQDLSHKTLSSSKPSNGFVTCRYTDIMRTVVLEMDERTLKERERLGLDRRDEMWEGVLHLVPPPSERHQGIENALLVALWPAAKSRGWRVRTDTGVFASASDYRVPDIVIYSPEAASERGVDGAPELVVEVASPGDESYEKIPWYFGRGAKAVLVIDRDTLALKLYAQGGPVPAASDGSVLLEPLDVRVAPSGATLVINGTKLEL